jgi:hypothetical protein
VVLFNARSVRSLGEQATVAKVDDKVMAAVEAALKKNPQASVDELFELAKGVNSGVGRLSKRQFHARYPLQVKRRSGGAKPKKAGRKKAGARRPRTQQSDAMPTRETVRGIFLRFASDLAGAEARKDVVKVVAGVDRYVDEVLKATASVT